MGRRTENNNNGVEQEQDDRLSSLPDDVLVDILSLLPIASAVATSVLSRRWRRLWTHITALDLDSHYFEGRPSSFFTVVGEILGKLASPLIRRFRLRIRFALSTLKVFGERHCWEFDSWIRLLCDLNVEEIKIRNEALVQPLTQVVPPCIFQTQSLVVLKLDGQYDIKLSDDFEINLPNLKILGMSLIYHYHYELMPKLVTSCPSLEQLDLVEGYKGLMISPVSVDISGQNLKRLSMKRFGIRKNTKVVIDAPKLESIYIKGFTWLRCCFVKNPIGLREAKVDINTGGVRESGEITFKLELFEAISNVRSLTLYHPELRAMTMFTNLTHLTVTLYYPREFKELMVLLEFFPVLEVLSLYLVIGFGELTLSSNPSDFVPTCLLTHVKRLRIDLKTLEDKKDVVMTLVKYMLSTAKVLEQLVFVIYSNNKDGDKDVEQSLEFEFCKELYEWPQRSSLCQIEFYGICLKILVKGKKVWEPNGHMFSFN